VQACTGYAAEEAERLGHKHIGTEHLLLGLLREEKCFAAEILQERGLKLAQIRDELGRATQEKTPAQPRQRESSLLAEFSRDLTQAAMDGQLDRWWAATANLSAWCRFSAAAPRTTPCSLVSPASARLPSSRARQRIADGEVPSFLADKKVLGLDLSLIVAGTKYRGQFEERLKTIMKELMENQNSIVFIDELHTLVGAGSAEARSMRPTSSSRRCRAAKSSASARPLREYRKSIEKDRSSSAASRPSRCRRPTRPTPSRSSTASRTATRNSTGQLHGCRGRVCGLSLQPLYPRSLLADKAIDLIDEAGRASNCAKPHCRRRSPKSRSASSSLSIA